MALPDKMFNSSYPEGNFGGNQLLDGSISMATKPCTRYAKEIAELLGHQCATTAPTPAVDHEEEKANGEVMDRHMAKTYRICVGKAWHLANYRLEVPRAARRLAQRLREPRHRDDQRGAVPQGHYGPRVTSFTCQRTG